MWHTGLVAPRHGGSFWTRVRTCVPRIGRKIFFCFFLNAQIFFKNLFILLFILVLAALGLRCCLGGFSLVVESRGYSSLRCEGFSLRQLLLLRSTGSRHAGFSSCGTRASVVVARRLSSCDSRALERRLSSCGAWA